MIKFFMNRERNKKTPKSPDYWGKVAIEGKTYKLAGWEGTNDKGDYISVQLNDDEGYQPTTGGSGYAKPSGNVSKPSPVDLDDEIPF